MMIKMLMLMILIVVQVFSVAKSAPLAPALFVFGDSLMDSGNNNLLVNYAKANYEPYGINFAQGPTGRFTNGRTTADFIAEYLGLPYAPPYVNSLLRELLHPREVRTGLNYASAASGILPQTGLLRGKVLSMDDQVALFEKTVKDEIPKYYKTTEEVSNFLAKSVFVIASGSNDYSFDDTNATEPASYQPFADLLILTLSKQLQKLYELGARKVIMFEMGPLGCIPAYTRKFKPSGPCVNEINQFAVYFNGKLAIMLENLTSTLGASSFILGRSNDLGFDAIINPSRYGLIDTSNPCCVAWFNGTLTCIPELWPQTCKDPNNHYFFDAYHPTETIYENIATRCFKGATCNPNIQQLVSQDN